MPINGSNTSKLQFTVEARHDGASYQCAVTNENGTVYSSIGRLNCKYTQYVCIVQKLFLP